MSGTSSEPDIAAADSFENRVAGLILLSMGLVTEDILGEAMHEAQRDPKRSLAAILMDSGKISQANREQLEQFSKAFMGWTRVVAGPTLEGRPIPVDPNTVDSKAEPNTPARPGEAPAGPPARGHVTKPGAGDSNYPTAPFPQPGGWPAVPRAGDPTFPAPLQSGEHSGAECAAIPIPDSQIAAARFAGKMRYQKLEVHRCGGLARVWVGKDLELDRTVAVKEILPARADDPDAREKFDTEARTTASLEHPSVIPVYGKGRQADGRPYYAMRFVTGTTYLEEIERWHHGDPNRPSGDRSLSFRKLLSHLLDVCNAVHYAHCNGILHLDLKPDNIMLGDFGETFVVDWGLSRTFEKTALVRASMTTSAGSGKLNSGSMIGSIPGTPQYMSPEQAHGRSDRLGPHTDVYSLGAVLYQLLVGQPPRAEAKSADEAWQLARSGIIKPPQSIRAHVDRDLSAICLKAMAYDPANRYISADELRRDLERWLAGSEVQARPLKPWHPEHLWRVIQRKRNLALSLVLVLPVVALLAVYRADHRAKVREETRFKEVIAEVLTKATSEDPSMTTVLEALLKYFKEASRSKDADDATIAENLEKMADICTSIATTDEAIEYQTKAIEHYNRILQLNSNQPEDFARLVKAERDLGWLFLEKGDFARATEHLKLLFEQLEKRPSSQDILQVQADVLLKLARAHNGKNELRESAQCLEHSGRILRSLLRDVNNARDQPRAREYLAILADSQGLLGDVKLALGNSLLAERAYAEARRNRKMVLDGDRENGEASIRCAWAADNFLRLVRRREDVDSERLRKELDTWDDDAHAVRKALYESKRNNRLYRRELAWSCLFRGEILLQLDQLSPAPEGHSEAAAKSEPTAMRREARNELARCYELARQLTDEDFSNADSRSHRAYSAVDLAYLYTREGNAADAKEKLQDAEQYFQGLMVDDATEVLYKSALRLGLLAELATTPRSRQTYQKQAEEKLRAALKQATSGAPPREWELAMLRALPAMQQIVDKLETTAASN
jgi:serine/threonine protein kinase